MDSEWTRVIVCLNASESLIETHTGKISQQGARK